MDAITDGRVLAGDWTDERIDLLKRLWAAKLTASEIGSELGISRNAVLGKLHRLGGPPSKPSRWTPEVIEKLKTLWANDVPYAVIARQLGFSRGSICAKVDRLGLRPRSRPVRRFSDVNLGRRMDTTRAEKAAHQRKSYLERLFGVPFKTVPLAALEQPSGKPCSLMELTADTCRFPIGDVGEPGFAFCGAQALRERPYCPFHQKLTHEPGRAPGLARPFLQTGWRA